ncbi:hypothetical protein Ciccas_005004 [Cichlidogyrus casuarinus]|uniref:XK-related protein n=1 Tax=Cichlidogyrus casuarinus TaxID=1844966 RepID=A0ABD2Q9X0_9PLAT
MAQLFSILCSWLSLAYSLSAYETSLRNSHTNKSGMTFLSSLTYTLWKAGILASRILSLALFAAAPSDLPEILFALVLAAIYIFDVVNLIDGRSRIWFAIFYSLMFIENMIFSLMWYSRYTIE